MLSPCLVFLAGLTMLSNTLVRPSTDVTPLSVAPLVLPFRRSGAPHKVCSGLPPATTSRTQYPQPGQGLNTGSFPLALPPDSLSEHGLLRNLLPEPDPADALLPGTVFMEGPNFSSSHKHNILQAKTALESSKNKQQEQREGQARIQCWSRRRSLHKAVLRLTLAAGAGHMGPNTHTGNWMLGW